MKVTIVGEMWATCADVISYRGIASEVVLLDIEGLPKGRRWYNATNTGFNTRVSGVTNDYTKTADSNVVVIPLVFQENQGWLVKNLMNR
jgi:malate dehydrogenase